MSDGRGIPVKIVKHTEQVVEYGVNIICGDCGEDLTKQSTINIDHEEPSVDIRFPKQDTLLVHDCMGTFLEQILKWEHDLIEKLRGMDSEEPDGKILTLVRKKDEDGDSMFGWELVEEDV